MTAPRGRADLHIHTLASDGVASVDEVLEGALAAGLDLIAIADHERIDAAVAARRIAQGRGLDLEVVVGEEVSTRGGHLVGLFLTRRIPPWRSLAWSVAQIHEQGGVAIVAHPLVPYPLCASARSIRGLLERADPVYHPDAIEAFNPTTARMRWSRRVPAFIEEVGTAAVAASDAHRVAAIGAAVTTYPGRSGEDLRRAIAERTTGWQGRPYAWREQVGMFSQQLRKYALGARDDVGGMVRRDGTGRDLGYPGGRLRPPVLDERAAGLAQEEPA